ncbi:glyoxalase [Sphingomonas sanguinis]|uniref:Glyoxalase n=1 Tax=Sphingomonas sanguinis TaxID=33051 RepID=A0ABU5LV75_9SPHN|nr:glyoxalase [Sphingomonas sanguinis]MDZ7283832.1 glyoxalase [Sphingomonas sanguinis]
MGEVATKELALIVHDLDAARAVCNGRTAIPKGAARPSGSYSTVEAIRIVIPIVHPRQAADASGNAVDGHHVPVPHFRNVLEMVDWQAHSDRLIAQTKFVIERCVWLEGERCKQAAMFFPDRIGESHRDEGVRGRINYSRSDDDQRGELYL